MAGILSHGEFRWLFFSNLAFFLAMQAQSIVRANLAWEMTNDEFALGTMMAAMAVPMALIAPFGGVMADRLDRRKLIVTGQSIVLTSESVVLVLLLSDALQFAHLVFASFVMGCVFPLIMPARQAVVANLVGREGLSRAIALNMAGLNATTVLGPAIGGLLDSISHEVAYVTGISFYATAVLCMFAVSPSRAEGAARDVSVLQNLADGVKYLGTNRLLLMLLLFGLVPMFLMMPFRNMVVVFVDDIWNQGRAAVGLMNAALGFGGIAGSILIAWIGDTQRRLGAMLGSMLAFAVLLIGFSMSPSFLVAIPFVVFAGSFSTLFSTLNNTAVQLLIPDEVRGRVSSFLMMSFSLPMIGVLPIGYLARTYGVQLAVSAAAVAAVVIALAMLAASRSLRNMNQAVTEALEDGASPVQARGVR